MLYLFHLDNVVFVSPGECCICLTWIMYLSHLDNDVVADGVDAKHQKEDYVHTAPDKHVAIKVQDQARL